MPLRFNLIVQKQGSRGFSPALALSHLPTQNRAPGLNCSNLSLSLKVVSGSCDVRRHRWPLEYWLRLRCWLHYSPRLRDYRCPFHVGLGYESAKVLSNSDERVHIDIEESVNSHLLVREFPDGLRKEMYNVVQCRPTCRWKHSQLCRWERTCTFF
jgi:hypothetical protein